MSKKLTAKKTIKTGVLFRNVELNREAINKDTRTVELSFSSESPVERYFGWEILDHSLKSVRLDRMKNGGPLLVDHDRTDLAGVIEDVSISSDRKGRAVARFGKSARAEEIYNDVLDGIRSNVSVGYRIHNMILEKEEEDVGTYRATDWEPMEISLVSIPADTTVGVGRGEGSEYEINVISTKKEEVKMEKCTICQTELVGGKCPACELRQARERDEFQKSERLRISEIMAMGQRHGLLDLAMEYVKDGKKADEFRSAVLEKISNAAPLNIQAGDPKAGDKPFRTFGDQLVAVAEAFTPGKRVDPRLLSIRAASGASEGVPSDGGFLIQQDFTLSLLDRVNQTGKLTPLCRRVPIGAGANGLKAPIVDESSRATGSRWGGVQVYRAAEAATVSSKKPKFAMLDLTLEKLMGICYATEELLRDSTALESIITQAFGEEFGFRMDDEIINGTGAGQMLGLLNAPCFVSVSKETGQAATTLVAENIQKMYARMWVRGVPNAVWFINQEVWPQLFSLKLDVGTGGMPMFFPPGGMVQAPFGTLLGRPVMPIEQCAALGTVGDVIFADLSQYLIIDKDGLTSDSSVHVRFLYDEMTFRFTMRNNGQPMWKNTITPYKGSSTISPFVGLATRA